MQDLVIKTGANIPYLLSDNEEKYHCKGWSTA